MLILLIKYISKYYERIGTEVAEIELTFSFPESWAIVKLQSISSLIDGEKGLETTFVWMPNTFEVSLTENR